MDSLQDSLTCIKTHVDALRIVHLRFIDSLVDCLAKIRADDAADDWGYGFLIGQAPQRRFAMGNPSMVED
jgi:hypothetical protein